LAVLFVRRRKTETVEIAAKPANDDSSAPKNQYAKFDPIAGPVTYANFPEKKGLIIDNKNHYANAPKPDTPKPEPPRGPKPPKGLNDSTTSVNSSTHSNNNSQSIYQNPNLISPAKAIEPNEQYDVPRKNSTVSSSQYENPRKVTATTTTTTTKTTTTTTTTTTTAENQSQYENNPAKAQYGSTLLRDPNLENNNNINNINTNTTSPIVIVPTKPPAEQYGSVTLANSMNSASGPQQYASVSLSPSSDSLLPGYKSARHLLNKNS